MDKPPAPAPAQTADQPADWQLDYLTDVVKGALNATETAYRSAERFRHGFRRLVTGRVEPVDEHLPLADSAVVPPDRRRPIPSDYDELKRLMGHEIRLRDQLVQSYLPFLRQLKQAEDVVPHASDFLNKGRLDVRLQLEAAAGEPKLVVAGSYHEAAVELARRVARAVAKVTGLTRLFEYRCSYNTFCSQEAAEAWYAESGWEPEDAVAYKFAETRDEDIDATLTALGRFPYDLLDLVARESRSGLAEVRLFATQTDPDAELDRSKAIATTPAAVPPSPERNRESREARKKRQEAEALAKLYQHPEWSNEAIAEAIGVRPWTLSRMKKFREARAAQKAGLDKFALGARTADGRLDPVDGRGQPSRGSRRRG